MGAPPHGDGQVNDQVKDTAFTRGPLSDLRVIELGTLLAGPFCGQLLGDLGAEVIKIEPPNQGDPLRDWGREKVNGKSLWWPVVARNKKAITLDLRQPEGQALLRELVTKADFLLENFRPGTLEKWGCGYAELSRINPRLIMIRVSGFGQTGPYSSQPGFGTLMEAMSGFADMTGFPDGPPILPTFALADSFAGFYAATAAMFAVYNRDVIGTGLGQVVDVSILESVFSMLGPNALVHQMTGEVPVRTGNRNTTSAPRNVYRTKDDRWIAIAASTQSTAERLFATMGQPELIEDPRFADNTLRVANADELDPLVGAWIAEQTLDC